MNRKILKQQAEALAQKTSNAYSVDAYRSWTAVCFELLKLGYTRNEVEAVVRSKWTRWARDMWEGNQQYGKYPAETVLLYLRTQSSPAHVANLTMQHFGSADEAYPADDIAELHAAWHGDGDVASDLVGRTSDPINELNLADRIWQQWDQLDTANR